MFDGVPVYVAVTQAYLDCVRSAGHRLRGQRGASLARHTGELIRTILDVGGDHPVTAVIGDRPIAVVGDENDPPQVVDLAFGEVAGELAGGGSDHRLPSRPAA